MYGQRWHRDERLKMSGNREILQAVYEVLLERKQADAGSSYVASLYAKGQDAILKKIGEEATETVMAAKDGVADKVVYEVADLWFHCLVLMAHENIEPDRVLDELGRRFGVSGLEEKASRSSN
jgi:phosphoribosyl-ATP pyrophosphohydrolase